MPYNREKKLLFECLLFKYNKAVQYCSGGTFASSESAHTKSVLGGKGKESLCVVCVGLTMYMFVYVCVCVCDCVSCQAAKSSGGVGGQKKSSGTP